jgi:hypothetical protein
MSSQNKSSSGASALAAIFSNNTSSSFKENEPIKEVDEENDDGSGSASGDGSYAESSGSHVSESTSASAGRKAQIDSMEDLDARESRQVFWAKVLVVLVLMASAGTVAAFIYEYATQQEYEDFDYQVRTWMHECVCV